MSTNSEMGKKEIKFSTTNCKRNTKTDFESEFKWVKHKGGQFQNLEEIKGNSKYI